MAVLYVTGVLEDGTPRASDVPVNPRVELAINKGSSNQIVLRVVNAGGVPAAPVGTLTLTVAQKPGDYPPLAQLAGTWTPMLGPGTAVFGWAKTAMADVAWGRYLYDIRLSNGDEVSFVVPASPFRLMPAV